MTTIRETLEETYNLTSEMLKNCDKRDVITRAQLTVMVGNLQRLRNLLDRRDAFLANRRARKR